MCFKIILFFVFLTLLNPLTAFARVTPNDIYQAKREQFKTDLEKIFNPEKKQNIQKADKMLSEINQSVCDRFDMDINKLSAILEEEKFRQQVTKTVVAYGQGNTPLDTAAYYLNYAAEANAFQKVQDYTPQIANGKNLAGGVNASISNLKSNLQTVKGKILRAKTEIKKAISYYEK